MKVIQVPFCFYPDPVGGTEVYVEALGQGLQRLGVEVVVAAPAEKEARYVHNGLPVRRFEVKQVFDDIRELYGSGDPIAAQAFSRILDEECPQLVHFHAMTPGVSHLLVREAKKRRLPVVFTYHTPTVSCQRGTLLRWGKEVCDGVLRLGVCTRCTLHGLGLPRGVADLVGLAPVAFDDVLGRLHRSGGMWTALRMRGLMAIRHESLRTFVKDVDCVIAVCEWVRDLIVRNGIPSEKVTLCRQGLAYTGEMAPGSPEGGVSPGGRSAPLRMVFLGRLDPGKGLHILIRAIRELSEESVTLDIYGIQQEGNKEARYRHYLQDLMSGDPRIRFVPSLPNSELMGRLREYSIVAVPSQLLETGPMVVLEAFSAGVPVLGSRLGGISELVQHEVNGLLVEPRSIGDWSRPIRRLLEEEGLLDRLRRGIQKPRTMEDVVGEMQVLYGKIAGSA